MKKAAHVLIVFATFACCSCLATKEGPIPTINEFTKVDTIYLLINPYDSTFVSQDLFPNRSKNITPTHQRKDEHRYKLIRDTIKYRNVDDDLSDEVRIEMNNEVKNKSVFVRHFPRYCLCFGISILVSMCICIGNRQK